MDMRYHWLTDIVLQKQYGSYYCPGIYHMGGYHTKNNSMEHHIDMRPYILHQTNNLNFLQGCVKLPHPQMCSHA